MGRIKADTTLEISKEMKNWKSQKMRKRRRYTPLRKLNPKRETKSEREEKINPKRETKSERERRNQKMA